MVKKLIFLVIIALFSIIAYSLGHQVFDSLQAGKRLETAAYQTQKLKDENQVLKKKLAEVSTVGFIESQARDKLNLARSGETVVVISQKEIDRVLGTQEKKVEIKLPNYQAWLKLIFKIDFL